MKKIILIVLAAVLALSLGACGAPNLNTTSFPAGGIPSSILTSCRPAGQS